MAKPLVAVETIYNAALRLLDEKGVDALSARNLAAELKCSTRTLYQQVGKRDELVEGLIKYHLGGLSLEFHPADSWQDSTRNWARAMRHTLLDHPNLARLMTAAHRGAVASYVNELLKVLLSEGFNEELALRACRVLANITVTLTLSEIIAPDVEARHKGRSEKEIQFEELVITRSGKDRNHFQEPPEVFDNAINWIVTGLDAEYKAS